MKSKQLAAANARQIQRIEVIRYEHKLGERSGVHPHSLEVDDWIRRSEKVAELAMSLKSEAGHLM